MQMYDRDKFKLIGREEPKKENKVILWLLLGLLIFAIGYVISFYF